MLANPTGITAKHPQLRKFQEEEVLKFIAEYEQYVRKIKAWNASMNPGSSSKSGSSSQDLYFATPACFV